MLLPRVGSSARVAGPGRRDPLLFVAIGLSVALALTVALFPAAPWRIPLALLAGVWAPGYALLGAVYPRGELSRLERHALAAAAGLCLLPVLTLLASETVGLHGSRVALVGLGATLLLSGVAWRRRTARPESAEILVRTRLPSTKVTVALCVCALLLAAAVEAASTLTSPAEPASLAMSASDGPLDLRLRTGEAVTLVVVARAGAATAAGDLVVTWDGAELHAERVDLAPGRAHVVELALPTGADGTHELEATWIGLRTDARLVVGGI